jgi:prophage DNA circulation protein
MPTTILTDAFDFRFKDLDLSGALVSWNDTFAQRVATHEYPKRDGAEQEPMGAAPARFRMRLCFLGGTWAKQYRALVASIRSQPRGLLVHPVFGNINVVCKGIDDAAIDPGKAKNLVDLTLSFEEDSVDTTIAAQDFQGPAAKAARVKNQAQKSPSVLDRLKAAVGIAQGFADAATDTLQAYQAVQAEVQKLSNAGSAYADAAVAATATSAVNPGLSAQLAVVGSTAITAQAAAAALQVVLLASPRGTTKVETYETVALCRQLYAACLELDEAIATLKPPLVVWTIQGQTTLATVLAAFYGPDAQARLPEVMSLNRIPNPVNIPAGFRMTLPAPTV